MPAEYEEEEEFTSDLEFKEFDQDYASFSKRNVQTNASINYNHYNELLQISKEISKIGSQNPQLFQRVKRDLNEIRSCYTATHLSSEVNERIGKKRGRPKKKHSKSSYIK